LRDSQAEFGGELRGCALPLIAVLHEGHEFFYQWVGRFGDGLVEGFGSGFERTRGSGGPDEGVGQAGQGGEIDSLAILYGGFEGAKKVREELGQEVAGGGIELVLSFAGGISEGEEPGEESARGDFGRDVTGFGYGEDDGPGEGERGLVVFRRQIEDFVFGEAGEEGFLDLGRRDVRREVSCIAWTPGFKIAFGEGGV
jgi:hypothetical protein